MSSYRALMRCEVGSAPGKPCEEFAGKINREGM